MGDRGNIVIQSGAERVFLYTHLEGSEIRQTLARALARKERWGDPSYLARIIFCEMVKGDEAGETGFGIWTHAPDNEHEILVVDTDKRMVFTYAKRNVKLEGKPIIEHTFEEFVSNTPQEVSHE